MTKVGKYITLAEAEYSSTAVRKAINNSIPEKLMPALLALVNNIYDPLCDKFGIKIPFDSLFRCLELNTDIGGSKNSQHMKCEAIDIDCDGWEKYGISNALIFETILKNFEFDQLIWEFGDGKNPNWVHVSFSRTKNRKQVLVSYKSKVKSKVKTLYKNYPIAA